MLRRPVTSCSGRQLQDPRPWSERPLFIAPSILLRDEPPVRDRRNVVVGLFLGSLGQLDLFAGYLLVGNEAEKMRNEVQPRAALVIGTHDVPVERNTRFF